MQRKNVDSSNEVASSSRYEGYKSNHGGASSVPQKGHNPAMSLIILLLHAVPKVFLKNCCIGHKRWKYLTTYGVNKSDIRHTNPIMQKKSGNELDMTFVKKKMIFR